MTVEEAKKKLVDVARSQVGYHEGTNNYNKYADDPRITKLYGWNVQNQPWCCTFVSWCFLDAFGAIGAKMTYGGSAACATQASYYKKNNAFYTSMPQLGDQIFFYSGGGINHTGIVVDVNGTTIRTVEGNYSDKVSECTYITSNSVIAGYGRPDWYLVNEAERPWVVVQNGQIVNSSAQKEDKPTDQGKPTEHHEWSPPLLKYDPNNYFAAVCVLQGLLNCWGWDSGKVDGYFGAKTQAAVNRARRWFGMDADGICDKELWNKLMGRGG